MNRDFEIRTGRPAWIAGFCRWRERDPAAALVTATMRLGIWCAGCTGALGLLIGLGASVLSGLGSLPEGAQAGTWVWALPPAAILGAMLVDVVLLGYLLWLIRRQIVSFRRSEARLRKQLADTTLLQEAVSAVHDLRSEDALQRVVEIVTGVLGFQRAALYLSDQAQEMFPRVYHSSRSCPKEGGPGPLKIDAGLINALLRLRTPVVIDETRGVVGIGAVKAGGDGGEMYIAVPLNGERGPLGVLVADSQDRESYCQADQDMLARLCKSAVVAIENASLHRGMQRMANRDGLTNLYNYRYFQQSLRDVLDAAGSQWPVSLLMIEIDKFKRYNDTYGHRQGDKALCSFARALEACTEPWNGLVARYGGDEFVVILARADCQQSARVAREVHAQVYQQTLGALAEYDLPPVTMSIGVATYPDDASNAEDLIEAADRAMYMVKYRGGNRVHVYSESATALS